MQATKQREGRKAILAGLYEQAMNEKQTIMLQAESNMEKAKTFAMNEMGKLYVTTGPRVQDIMHVAFECNPEALQGGVSTERVMQVEMEPWFGVPYTCEPVPAALVQSWHIGDPKMFHQKGEAAAAAAAAAALHLPPRNPFQPSDFALRGGVSGRSSGTARQPTCVKKTATVEVWHKLDDAFDTPRACVMVATGPQERGGLASASEPAEILLLAALLQDALREDTYLAEMFGLECHVAARGRRLVIRVYGFSHKLPALLERALREVATHQVDPARLALQQEVLARRFCNSDLQPMRHAAHLRRLALQEGIFPSKEVAAAMATCTAEGAQVHLDRLLRRGRTVALVHGNVSSQEAEVIGDMVSSVLSRSSKLDGSHVD
ncbi:hypothetical protein CYMTET_15428, partial [Cymbomonas tetramitiformis]